VKLRPITLTLILAVAAIVWILIFVALQILWPDWRMVNANIHSAAEALGGMMAIVMAAFLSQRRRDEYGGKLFLLAVGLLGMGVLDVFHATVSPGKGFVLLHSTASLVGGLWFALIFLPWCARDGDSTWRKAVPWLVAAASVGFGIWTHLDRQSLPVMTVDGRFTATAIAFNVLAGAFFATSAARLLFDFYHLGKFEIYLYACIATLFGLVGLMFPYSALWDGTWWLWHMLRLTAYALGLIYVVSQHYQMVVDLRVALTEREKTEEEIRQRNRDLSVLYTIRRRAMQSLDLTKVLNDSLSATLESLGVEAGAVVLTDPDGKMMTIHVHTGLSEEFVRNMQHIKLGEGVTGKTVAEKKPVVLYISEYPTARLAPFVVKEGFQTLASTPLMSAGQVLGALTLGTHRVRAFPPEELELLAGIGQLLGGAVQNAQLYQQVQQELAERKRAEEVLRESEERYRSLFENMLNGFAYCRMLYENSRPQDFIYLDVNKAFESLTGLKNVIGRKVSDVIPGIRESDKNLFEIYGRVAWTGKPETFEIFVESLNDWYSISVYSPKKEFFVAVFDVITERKHVEESLSIKKQIGDIFLTIPDDEMFNEVLKVILEVMHSPFGVFGYIDETGGLVVPTMTRQIWDKCQVPEKSIRFPRETWGDSSWPRALRDKRTVHSNEPSANIPEGHVGIQRHISLPILFQSGSIGLFQVANKETDYSETDIRRLEMIADYVAPVLSARINRKRAEDEIKKLNAELETRVMERTAQLESANRELEAFSYSVSHDLRAPLRSIDGFSRIIVEEYANKLDEEGKRLLNVVRSNTQRMGELITDLLNLSRVTRDEMKAARVDMSTLANSVYHEVASPEVQKWHSFSIEPLPDAHCDPSLMRQVWRNLISNAIKFTASKDLRKIDIGGSTKDGMNEYFIRDSGVGFDPRYIHKLFGVFQRLHKAEEFEGTGVGLAIVQRIVHRHGGRVWAEGILGQGATFYFSLPSKEKNLEQL